MSFQTESLPISLLEHSLDHKQRTLFRAWRAGDMAETIIDHADHLALLTINRQTNMPVELYKGEKSLAARVLGKSWQKDLLDSSGSSKILEAYDLTRFGEPTYEYVCHEGDRQGRAFRVAYERLVLPFKIGGGLPQFVTLSSQVAFEIQPIDAQSRDNAHAPSHIANSLILLGTEERASSRRRVSG